MNVLVLGATGATGRQIVQRALLHGHDVAALVRDPARLGMTHAHLTVAVGNVADRALVARAVQGREAVVSALGSGSSLRSDPPLIVGIGNIVHAMQQEGVRRLVYQSMLGAGGSRGQMRFVDRYFVVPFVLRHVVADHSRKEALIRQSGLDWIIVRPPRLTNGPYTGHWRGGEAIREASLTESISRADVAEFMVRQLTTDAYLHQAPALLH